MTRLLTSYAEHYQPQVYAFEVVFEVDIKAYLVRHLGKPFWWYIYDPARRSLYFRVQADLGLLQILPLAAVACKGHQPQARLKI